MMNYINNTRFSVILKNLNEIEEKIKHRWTQLLRLKELDSAELHCLHCYNEFILECREIRTSLSKAIMSDEFSSIEKQISELTYNYTKTLMFHVLLYNKSAQKIIGDCYV